MREAVYVSRSSASRRSRCCNTTSTAASSGGNPCSSFTSRPSTRRRGAQIPIHVRRVDAVPAAVSVQVLKQFLSRKLLTLLDDAGDAAVGDLDSVLHAALAAEIEAQHRPGDGGVAVAQRRQAEGAVV